MMKVSRFITLSLLTTILLAGCDQQKNIVKIELKEQLNTESRELKDFPNDGVKSLEKMSYSYSTNQENKIIALIFKENDKWSYREYWVENGENLTLKGDEGQLIYLSLPANRTVAYSWSLISSGNSEVANEVTYNEWFHIPFDNAQGTVGENYDRQIFDLSTLNKSLPFKLEYKHSSEERKEIFECIIEKSETMK